MTLYAMLYAMLYLPFPVPGRVISHATIMKYAASNMACIPHKNSRGT